MGNKWKAKTVIWFFVVLFFLIASAFFLIDNDSSVMVATASGYIAILSAWLGFDIAKTRDRTLSLPVGEFENLRISRYVFSLMSIGMLLMLSLVRDKGTYGPVKVLLIPCFFGIGAMIIGAYGAVKTATPKGPDK